MPPRIVRAGAYLRGELRAHEPPLLTHLDCRNPENIVWKLGKHCEKITGNRILSKHSFSNTLDKTGALHFYLGIINPSGPTLIINSNLYVSRNHVRP